MTHVDWNDREEAANEAFQEPAQRVALKTDYGFCAYGDAPAAIGGGTPWFYWFETEEAMLAALSDHALFLNMPRSNIDLSTMDAAVKARIATAGRGDLEALRCDLNQYLRGASQLIWMGTFKDLCESEHPKAKDFRGEFRTDATTSPIKLDEMESFAEFIGRYGV